MDEQAAKKITRARAQLILRKPFFGYLAIHLEPKEVPTEAMRCPTMGTDGEKLYYVAEFVNQQSDELLQSIICHECLHCAFGHCWRIGDRDPLRWNLATDGAVNYQLQEQGFQLPEGVVILPEAENLSAEELYLRIRQEEQKFTVSGAGGESRDIEGKSSDDHSQWGKTGNGDEGKNGGSSKEMQDIGNGLARAEHSAREMQDRWKEWASQARQLAKSQGAGIGSLEQQIDELLEPKLPWRELLRNFMLSAAKSNYRLMPPNRKHLWRGLYLPSSFGTEIEIVFAIDTSGSMSDEEVIEGLSEVKSICDMFENYTIHLYQADYGIQEYKELTAYNFDFPDKIKGRGGTSFCHVFEDIKEKNINPACIIYFTDLMGDFPDQSPQYPVIWLATSEHDVPFGEVIRYEKLGI